MTAEDKAKQLIENFREVGIASSKEAEIHSAKQCALIAVEEILNLQNMDKGKWLPTVVPDSIKYWQSVKEAINQI